MLGAGGTTQNRDGRSDQRAVVSPVHVQRRQPRRHPASVVRSARRLRASQNYGNGIPRDLFSIQNGFDLFSRRLRINDAVRLQGRLQHAGRREQLPVQLDAALLPRDAGSDGAARAAGARDREDVRHDGRTARSYKTGAGYFINGQFWKFRELSAVVQLPDRVNASRCARRAARTLVFGARNLHTWTKFTGIDPEANYGVDTAAKSRTSSRRPPRRRTSRSVSISSTNPIEDDTT